MNFTKTDGRYHIYHSEGGEGYLKFLTRANVICVGWASLLLGFEIVNPFFGWWHGLSNSFMVIVGLIGSRMLHHYSTRMVNNLWILQDGKHIEVQFMNAFFLPKTEKFRIMNFGYLQESRLNNTMVSTYQQDRSLYINFNRNAFHHLEHTAIIKKVMTGQELSF